jgi:tetratricopeptide (TPR) repeat protein
MKMGRCMVESCTEIDKRIGQYRHLLPLAILPADREIIDRLIERLREERTRLHENQMGRWHMVKGMTYNYMGRYEDAILQEQAALDSGYSTWTVYVHLAVANAFLGRQSEADAAVAQARKLNPKLTVKWYGARLDAPETIHEGLRKAGVPEE